MRSRIIIYNNRINSILLIHRKKGSHDYWVIPGGTAKENELPNETALREVAEELLIKIDPENLSKIFSIVENGERQFFYLAQVTTITTPKINGEELQRSNDNNIYLPTWVTVENLAGLNLLPLQVKDRLLKYLFEIK